MTRKSSLALSLLFSLLFSTVALAAKGKKKPNAPEADVPDFAIAAFSDWPERLSIAPSAKR